MSRVCSPKTEASQPLSSAGRSQAERISTAQAPQSGCLNLKDTGPRSPYPRLGLLSTALLLLLVAAPAMGQNTTWTGGEGDLWTNATLWTNGLPTSSKNAILDNGHTAVINQLGQRGNNLYLGSVIGTTGHLNVVAGGNLKLNASAYVGHWGNGTVAITNGAQVSNELGSIGDKGVSTGSVTVDGANSTWTNSSALYVGASGNGTLAITNGAQVTNWFGDIGRYPGSTGSVTVHGANSTWTNSSGLMVGTYGNGTLAITNGGLVSNTQGSIGHNSDSTGSVTIDGAKSTWINSNLLSVGGFGNGTLAITNGARVFNTSGRIGSSSGSTGSVTVHGANSTWTNSSELHVGSSGNSTLAITNGALVSNTKGYIGYSNTCTGSVTVDGANSTWTNSYELYVGALGNGTLAITNGAQVSNTSGYIGYIKYLSDATGIVTVHGANSTWTNSSELCVGNQNNGMLAITNGGKASNANGYIGRSSGSTGTVTVIGVGSTWMTSNNLYVGGDETLVGGRGYVTVANGGLLSAAKTLKLWNTGTLWINGGTVSVRSFDRSAGGTLHFNDGALTVNGGNFTWNSTNLTINGNTASALPTLTLNAVTPSATYNTITVGNTAKGNLTISGGTHLANSGSAYLGYNNGSTGSVTLTGAGSTWTSSNNLYIGGSESAAGGLGTVNVTDGGLLSVGGTLQVWQTGTLYVNGGTLSAGALTGNGTIHLSGPSGSAGLILGSTVNSTFSGTLADGSTPASLLKIGAGVQTLSGNNTYSGGTTVQAGSLLATNTEGSATGLGDVDVQGGATLGGNGTIGASGSTVTIQNNGTLAPGMSPGTLHIAGDLDLEAGAILAFELNDPDSTTLASDKLLVAETFSTEPGVLMDLALQNGYTPELGDAWTVVEYANFSGNASDVTVRSTLADPDLSYNLAVVGNSLVLSVVPEPATIATIGSGLLTLAGLWWHRRRRRAPGGLLASLRPSGRAASGHRSMSRVGPDHSRSHRSPHRKRRSSGHPH